MGQEPVGPVEQVQVVVIRAGELHPGAVGAKLHRRQERLLGVFFALRDVVHRHGRGGVPGIALQNLDRQPELGEASELGVAEPVGVAEPDRPARAVGDRDDLAELPQPPAVGF